MADAVEEIIECDSCGRTLKPALAVNLYGDDEGTLIWQAGPYGTACALEIARTRWKQGLMTYRVYDTNGPAQPYRFSPGDFGADLPKERGSGPGPASGRSER